MDVGGWLRGLGLDQYEPNFRDNKIEGDVLPQLTADDLKDIGVNAVGDRRRLLAAIAALSGPTPSNVPASPPELTPAKGVQLSAERRPITVMFCDLVGSTGLASSLDAEDWRNLVGAYLDAASEAVAGLGGHVQKKLGDGLMALFGYPRALENDAERAVRAALAIQRALADLNVQSAQSGSPELSARIGLESGPVVVDSAGEVFGEAPNVAARVQAIAEPGTVLVTATVHRHVAGLFVVQDRGAQNLKGVPRPVTLYRIVRASGGGRRGGARALTSLVGREDELSQLGRLWARALQGEGQFVQIVGEPGIGKSRLIEEFRGTLAETPHTWIEWAASQLLHNTTLHPIAEWGRQRFSADVVPERRLVDLESALSQVRLDPAEYAPLLAPLFDIALPPLRAAALAPEDLRRRQLAAVTAWFLAGARSQPVVLTLEDLHWADPTSLDLLSAFAELGAEAPLLVVATARPEFLAPWGTRAHHNVISLAPLDRAQVRRMVDEIASGHALADEVVDRVGERTGGVPLFVEEVTRLLIEGGAQDGAQAIPPTLQQSLAARLDRLGVAREAAQIGAVLGRDFSYALLRSVAALDDRGRSGFTEAALKAALDGLTGSDLVFVEGTAPDLTYRFKHALIQDAAYDSLLRSHRRTLHRRAAEALRDANAEPEAIAHHFTQAGLDDLAIEWWGKAGDQALRRSAFQEAIAHLGKAIAMWDKAGDRHAAGASGQRQHLQAAYGNALIATRGYGARETTEAFAAIRKSPYGGDVEPERFAAAYGLWVGSCVRGELAAMRAHAAAFRDDVEAGPGSPEAGIAQRILGATHWFAGEYVEARDHLERALALFQPGRDDDFAFRVGQDAGVASMLYLALTLWPLGDIGRAVSLVDGAQARIADFAHIQTRMYGTNFAALFELMRGDLARAATYGVELARLAREHDLPFYRAPGVFLEGVAMAQSGAPAAGLEEMRRGVELLSDQNVVIFDGLLKVALAEAEARAGNLDEALAILDEARATSERIGHRAFDAELRRVRGEMLLRRDSANPAPAEEAFQAAIAIAREQKSRSFALRAALSLAKLYRSTGRPVEAHDVLAPALEGFAPTPEMPEIAEAQALLPALMESDALKAEVARSRRRLDLQTSYGQALLWAKGFAAEEPRAAFARAEEFVGSADDSATRAAVLDAHCLRSFMRGEFREAQDIAEFALREPEEKGVRSEAGPFRRMLGLIQLYRGELKTAHALLEKEFDQPDLTASGRVNAAAFLALTQWHLGEVDAARRNIELAISCAEEAADAKAIGTAYFFKTILESRRDDASSTRLAADTLLKLSEKHGMQTYLDEGRVYANWGGARVHDSEFSASTLEQALATYVAQGNLADAPSLYGLLAELQASVHRPESALLLAERGLSIAERTGERFTDPYLHRLRGELLLRRNAADPAPAEAALRTAIVVAQEQGARTYGLLAALTLAKLYHSTDRRADADAVLGDALEGITPTPVMPEIAEAYTLRSR